MTGVPVLIVRANVLHKPDFWLCCLVVAAWIALAVAQDSLFAVGAAVVFSAFEAGLVWISRITVTDSQVLVGHPRPLSKVVQRDTLGYLRVRSGRLNFYDRSRNKVAGTQTAWTDQQYLRLSETLSVPVYDHRTMHGLGQRKDGKVLTREGKATP